MILSSRSRPKGNWLSPNNILFNWPVSGSPPANPRKIMKPPLHRKKVKKVEKLTFPCEKYNPDWLRRFLKNSGSKVEPKPQRESRNVPHGPCHKRLFMVRLKPMRRCQMKPRRPLSYPLPKVNKFEQDCVKVVILIYNLHEFQFSMYLI